MSGRLKTVYFFMRKPKPTFPKRTVQDEATTLLELVIKKVNSLILKVDQLTFQTLAKYEFLLCFHKNVFVRSCVCCTILTRRALENPGQTCFSDYLVAELVCRSGQV